MPKPVERSVPMSVNQFGAVEQDRGHRGDGLDVVDDRRPGVETRDGRERRLQARLAAAALEGVEQRRLLTADVGAGTGVHA